jgi:RNA polymerase sigma-70 factor (ECF subfamily)
MQRADSPDASELTRPRGDADQRRREAFQRLADGHLDPSYRLALAIMGNPSEAEDATHDAFVIAWQKWGTLRDPSVFEGWFMKILINTCRNRLRRIHRTRHLDVSDELRAAGADQLRRSDDRALIEPALASISPDHQVVIALRFYRDMSIDQIGRVLSLPSGTVKSRLHYGLAHMARILGETNEEEPE